MAGRLEAEAAGDDFLLDFGGAAEALRPRSELPARTYPARDHRAGRAAGDRPGAMPMRPVDEGDGAAAVADADMPVLTTGMVRDTLERIRR